MAETNRLYRVAGGISLVLLLIAVAAGIYFRLQSVGAPPGVGFDHYYYIADLLKTGNYAEAEAEYKRALLHENQASNRLLAQKNLVYALLAQGKAEEAIPYATEGLSAAPDDLDLRRRLITALIETGRAEETVPHYRELLRLNPEDVAAHNNLGRFLEMQGKTDEAIEHFRRASELDPTLVQGHFNLGRGLLARGDTPGAVASLRRVVELQTDQADAFEMLAFALKQSGDIPGAIAQLRRAVEVEPRRPTSHYMLGAALLLDGQSDEATQHFEEAAQLAPTDSVALNNAAWVLATHPEAGVRRPQAALAFAERAVERAGASQVSLDTLAAAQAAAGQHAEAVKTAERALALSENEADTAGIRQRIEAYRAGRGHREPPIDLMR